MFISKRTTNPLNPKYVARDDLGNLIEIGEVDGSKPTTLPPMKKDPSLMPSSSLITKDILGAGPSTKG